MGRLEAVNHNDGPPAPGIQGTRGNARGQQPNGRRGGRRGRYGRGARNVVAAARWRWEPIETEYENEEAEIPFLDVQYWRKVV